ncbi:pyridoxine 5'-phosphate synthase [Candidatus Aerophobetes bacterium]|uniref:Pyridoxine 5'-phosphate synthase n=1 Tax=Aerophobetes bacterium TaxID=2030807 RepID=A0A523UNZ3_UNCAE|nr:MAG: pyridoxine 5'-phosphate synthase [Candidatus Aerophobetes bacterium]
MIRLSVNVDHVATLREARGGTEPDPVAAALLVELGGARGITVHLREDRRHIQERDVELLRTVIKTKLNLEMGVSEEIVKIALKIKPDMATLVPEEEGEVTTQGGLDLSRDNPRLKEVISLLHQAKIPVSLFINPDPNSVKKSHRLGADMVELHTGIYAEKEDPLEAATEVERIAGAVALARKLTLGVNAGHDLNYQNVDKICLIEDIEEFSIGHSIISRACLVGMKEATREMVRLIEG